MEHSFHRQQMVRWVVFWINSWDFDQLVKFADPGIVVYENIGFRFVVGDDTTIVGHCFIWWVDIWNTVQTLDDFPHWRRSFQFSVLTSLVALVASLQALIHSCWFWWIVWWRQLWVWILARTCGVIQGLDFLLGLFSQRGLLQKRWEYRWNEIYKEIDLVLWENYPFLTWLRR